VRSYTEMATETSVGVTEGDSKSCPMEIGDGMDASVRDVTMKDVERKGANQKINHDNSIQRTKNFGGNGRETSKAKNITLKESEKSSSKGRDDTTKKDEQRAYFFL